MNSLPQKMNRSLLRTLFPQLLLLSIVAVFYSLSLFNLIPAPDQLNNMLVKLFRDYGLPIVALSSFLENLIGVNAYFPGAFTILTGMSLTAGHPMEAILTYFAIYIPAFSANILSFCAGRLQKQTDNKVDTKNPWTWFFFTYWHPQLAALTAFATGARGQISFQRFFLVSAPVSFFWSIFWALVIYRFGLMADVGNYFITLFLLYIAVWTAIDMWRYFHRSAAN